MEEEAVNTLGRATEGVVKLPQRRAERVGHAELAVARHRARLAHVQLLALRSGGGDLASVGRDETQGLVMV